MSKKQSQKPPRPEGEKSQERTRRPTSMSEDSLYRALILARWLMPPGDAEKPVSHEAQRVPSTAASPKGPSKCHEETRTHQKQSSRPATALARIVTAAAVSALGSSVLSSQSSVPGPALAPRSASGTLTPPPPPPTPQPQVAPGTAAFPKAESQAPPKGAKAKNGTSAEKESNTSSINQTASPKPHPKGASRRGKFSKQKPLTSSGSKNAPELKKKPPASSPTVSSSVVGAAGPGATKTAPRAIRPREENSSSSSCSGGGNASPTSVRFGGTTVHHVEIGPGRHLHPITRGHRTRSGLSYINAPAEKKGNKVVVKFPPGKEGKLRRHRERQAAMARYWLRTEQEEAEWRAEATRAAEREALEYCKEPASPLHGTAPLSPGADIGKAGEPLSSLAPAQTASEPSAAGSDGREDATKTETRQDITAGP
ncbi:hypothetical protein VTK73DRAFT_9242 [Phialemonium thermophilum]|uniref:Uncharacterized protein n=1 Tax=Phialemonium thermophilum TaxID=223376 RepID=A0ABR3XKS3_9PEZI